MPQAVDWAAVSKSQPERVLYGFARLNPGVTIPQAEEQLKPVFDYAMSQVPPRFRSEVHLRVRSLRDRQMQDAQRAAWILLGAVFAVLLIACTNVASLLLTRAAARDRELAVRAALGASRPRLIRQALVEAMLLSIFASALGFALAASLLRIFIAIAPSGLPFLHNAQLDLRIAGFTIILAALCGLAFGLIPALHAPRSMVLTARKQPAGMRAWLRKAMVIGQIAASMILLAGASLLVRSFAGLETQQLGLRTRGVVTAAISLSRYRYTTPQAQMQFFLQAEAAVRKLPGVATVALSDSVPPGGFRRDHIYSIMAVDGRPAMSGGTQGMVAWRWVTPAYFRPSTFPSCAAAPSLKIRGHRVST